MTRSLSRFFGLAALLIALALPVASHATSGMQGANGTGIALEPDQPTNSTVVFNGPVDYEDGVIKTDPRPYLTVYKNGTDMRVDIVRYNADGSLAGHDFYDDALILGTTIVITPTWIVNSLGAITATGNEGNGAYTLTAGVTGTDQYGRTIFSWSLARNTVNSGGGIGTLGADPPVRRGH